MAPELFQEGGAHSSASDLWALGCVLYQLAVGHPPFVAGEFSQLVSDILSTQPRAIPGASLWSTYPSTNRGSAHYAHML